MTTLSIQLPDSVHGMLLKLAEKDGISISNFLTIAAAEKMSALLTSDYLKRESARARREDFEVVLDSVPDAPPDVGDELPLS